MKPIGWWGNLGSPSQKGIITYTISPYEQRVFAGAITKGIPSFFRRVLSQMPYFLPPTLIYLGVYFWAKDRNAYLNSKAGMKELEEKAESQ